MGMTEDVLAVTPYRKKAWVMERLGDEAEEFRALLANPQASPTLIHDALVKRDIIIPYRTLYRWWREAQGKAAS